MTPHVSGASISDEVDALLELYLDLVERGTPGRRWADIARRLVALAREVEPDWPALADALAILAEDARRRSESN